MKEKRRKKKNNDLLCLGCLKILKFSSKNDNEKAFKHEANDCSVCKLNDSFCPNNGKCIKTSSILK